MRAVVIDASLSEAATSARLGDQLIERLPEQWQVQRLQLRPLAHELVDNLLTGFPSPALEQMQAAVQEAEVAIVLTPTYQAGYSGLLKLFFDTLPEQSLAGTAVLIGATGGTARHALMVEHAVRPLLSYLHAVVVPTALFVAADDWGGIQGADEQDGPGALARRLDRAVAELKLLAQLVQGLPTEVVEPSAPTAERKVDDGLAFARTKVDDLDTVVPFEVLLRSV
ncbi:hypothetical protein EII12_01015 [Buchananella hordeovulneris]|uniref:CE1759 family FMN reductase n=1 Tax=Buchananella hordeovulneris TaxID=52770 RepID=UPI000F601F1C|nr:CE1759 family FMN reductase [Buchananella hordeovulneris]RRD53612.1 hypothetical protein EII12_01015 [Buchananella hordeovulneris]